MSVDMRICRRMTTKRKVKQPEALGTCLSYPEAARELQESVHLIRTLVKSGRLEAIEVNGRPRVTRQSLRAFLAKVG
jgi:hypothetical protein